MRVEAATGLLCALRADALTEAALLELRQKNGMDMSGGQSRMSEGQKQGEQKTAVKVVSWGWGSSLQFDPRCSCVKSTPGPENSDSQPAAACVGGAPAAGPRPPAASCLASKAIAYGGRIGAGAVGCAAAGASHLAQGLHRRGWGGEGFHVRMAGAHVLGFLPAWWCCHFEHGSQPQLGS